MSNLESCRRLLGPTGGEAFLPMETSPAIGICERIGADIRNQYTAGYVPSNQSFDNTYRAIRVVATGPHGQKYLIRTRERYIAAPEREAKPR